MKMENINVNIQLTGKTDIYEPNYISFGDNCVIGCGNSRNMGFLLGYCTKEEEILRKQPIQAEMDQYNNAVRSLWAVQGFKEYFASHHSYVSIKDIESNFGLEAASFARNICTIKNCYPDLMLVEGILQLRGAKFFVSFEIDGKNFSFDIENSTIDTFSMNNKICSLDWTDETRDRLLALIFQFYKNGVICGNIANPILDSAEFLVKCGCVDPRHMAAMNYTVSLLQNRGYLRQFCLKTDNFNEIWSHYTKREDHSALFTVLNPSYLKDKLLCERINCLWSALYSVNENGCLCDSELNLDEPFYFLQDENDHTYVSTEKAKFGGHKKLHIYGRLDCPSALRFVAKGQYVQHRVFFKDEETAIAAGYRPCGVCMKEKYKVWKIQNASVKFL